MTWHSKKEDRLKMTIYLPIALWRATKARFPYMKNNAIVEMAIEKLPPG